MKVPITVLCYVCEKRPPRSKWNCLCLVCMADTAIAIENQIKKHGPITSDDGLRKILIDWAMERK